MAEQDTPVGEEVQEPQPEETLDDVLAAVEPPKEEIEEEQEEDKPEELPEKYRGKTPAELARMHQEAEKALGRQSNEVGELRKAFDDFVQESIKSKDKEPEEEVDFFTDPKKAIAQAIDNHPKLRAAENISAEMQRDQSIAKLRANYPEMESTLGDPNFQDWVKASPIRTKLYTDADKRYDYDSAAELLDLWKDRQMVINQTLEMEKVSKKKEATEASTGATRGNPDGKRAKKVYRRSDIIELMRDPVKYAKYEDEIARAYAEGRVQ